MKSGYSSDTPMRNFCISLPIYSPGDLYLVSVIMIFEDGFRSGSFLSERSGPKVYIDGQPITVTESFGNPSFSVRYLYVDSPLTPTTADRERTSFIRSFTVSSCGSGSMKSFLPDATPTPIIITGIVSFLIKAVILFIDLMKSPLNASANGITKAEYSLFILSASESLYLPNSA